MRIIFCHSHAPGFKFATWPPVSFNVWPPMCAGVKSRTVVIPGLHYSWTVRLQDQTKYRKCKRYFSPSPALADELQRSVPTLFLRFSLARTLCCGFSLTAPCNSHQFRILPYPFDRASLRLFKIVPDDFVTRCRNAESVSPRLSELC